MSAWIVPIIVSAIAAAGTWGGVRWGRKGDRENAIIDQLQEDRDKDRERLDRLEAEINTLRREVVEQRGLLQQWAWHAERVEVQVVELGGTPHPRPLALRRQEEPAGD